MIFTNRNVVPEEDKNNHEISRRKQHNKNVLKIYITCTRAHKNAILNSLEQKSTSQPHFNFSTSAGALKFQQ